MRGGSLALALVTITVAGIACSAGRSAAVRPLRVTATETSGEVEFTVQQPITRVTCVERDYRRSPSDAKSARVIWSARCTAGNDCLPSIHYGDRRLESLTPPQPLAPSIPGTCYECAIEAGGNRGQVSFQMTPRGSFDRCSPRVGDL